ncbi:hypothetical protein VPH35_053946 [Triticum aestivum]
MVFPRANPSPEPPSPSSWQSGTRGTTAYSLPGLDEGQETGDRPAKTRSLGAASESDPVGSSFLIQGSVGSKKGDASP